MRVMIEVPDRLAQDALREHRTVRQQAEYLIACALRAAEQRPNARETRDEGRNEGRGTRDEGRGNGSPRPWTPGVGTAYEEDGDPSPLAPPPSPLEERSDDDG